MKKRILIHVGRSRSLSIFFHMRVFPFLENVYFEGSYRTPDHPLTQLMMTIMNQHPLTIDFEEEKRKLNAFLETVKEDNVLMSFESLDGLFVANYRDQKLIIDLLKEFFPEAKILMLFRRQDDWLESIYKLQLYFGYTVGIRKFLNYEKDGTFGRYHFKKGWNIDVRDLNYYVMVKYYYEKFGKENVTVLPLELFKAGQEAFMKTVFTNFGIKPFYPPNYDVVNKQFTLVTSYFALIFNRFLRRPWNPSGFIQERPFFAFLKARREKNIVYRKLFGLTKRLRMGWLLKQVDNMFTIRYDFIKPDVRAKIMKMHEPDNRKLSELIGIPLDRFKYY